MFLRIITLLVLTMLAHCSMKSQPLVQLEGNYWHMPVLDNVIQAYNFAHPWETVQLVPIGQSYSLSAGWNQSLYAPRAIHAIGLVHYGYQTTRIESPSALLTAGFHTAGLSAMIRTHPKCLVKKVQSAGPLGTRWYLQVGGGYLWNMPFAFKHGQRVTLHDTDPYRAVSGNVRLSLGTGWHALTIGSFILTLEANALWMPQFTLDGFATAVMGHNQLALDETAYNAFMLQGGLRLTWGKLQKNWWDEPRKGDKS